MLEVLLYTTYWWFILFLLSLSFFPLAKIFLKETVDQGFIAAKMLGILITTFSLYILSMLRLVQINRLSVVLVLLVWIGINYFLAFKKGRLLDFNQVTGRKVVVLEITFFLLFFLMAIIRSYQPQINGLEKFMDYGFINAALNTEYWPPKDMWWANETINYYYFGHLWSAVLILLTGTSAAYSYNLILALIFALSGSLLVVFGWTWTQKLWAGLVSAFLHLGIGNLHFMTTVLQKGESNGAVGVWDQLKSGWESYWYPDGSRLIYHVITEFPVYSFVVYDLHAHVLNFAPNLLIIGFVGEVYRRKRFLLADGVLLGFLLGLNFLSNAWDLPIYYMLLGLMLLVFITVNVRKLEQLWSLIISSVAAAVSSALVIVPFWLHYDKLELPILPTSSRSPLWQLFQLWGFWWILGISFLILLLYLKSKRQYFDYFIGILFITGLLLIIIPEFVFVKDIYGADYERANTVFKLTFQSWNLFAMGSGYIIWRVWATKFKGFDRLLKYSWLVMVILLTVGCFAYTVRAYKSGYGDFKTFSGLDGEEFLETTFSLSEAKALDWVKKNTPKDSVVLEAAGDSYTNYQRVSVFTGRSTIVGWAVHEWLWRGGFDEVGKRQTDVQTLYTTADDILFKELVSKYRVDYIFISALEREKYLNMPGGSLLRFCRPEFQEEGVEVRKCVI